MKGLEALDNWYNTEQPKPVEYCFHYNIIRKELKVLQILKEKRVDLPKVYRSMVYYVEEQNILEEYNRYQKDENKLTLEEMQLIVEWLKEV